MLGKCLRTMLYKSLHLYLEISLSLSASLCICSDTNAQQPSMNFRKVSGLVKGVESVFLKPCSSATLWAAQPALSENGHHGRRCHRRKAPLPRSPSSSPAQHLQIPTPGSDQCRCESGMGFTWRDQSLMGPKLKYTNHGEP